MGTESTRERLPRGPHGLSREHVAGSQRTRLLDAMVDAVADKGYARTVVTDVVTGAGVSRAAFYAQFADIEACFLAAYERSVERVMARIAAATPAGAKHPTLAARLDAYLAAIAAEPRAARVFLIDVYGAGPRALARRFEVLASFTELVAASVAGIPGWPSDPGEIRLRSEAIVGAISMMVATRIAAGQPERVAEIRAAALALAGIDA